ASSRGQRPRRMILLLCSAARMRATTHLRRRATKHRSQRTPSKPMPLLSFVDFVKDPTMGMLQAFHEPNGWFPIQVSTNARVVRVSGANAYSCVRIVPASQFDPRNTLDDIHESIDSYKF